MAGRETTIQTKGDPFFLGDRGVESCERETFNPDHEVCDSTYMNESSISSRLYPIRVFVKDRSGALLSGALVALCLNGSPVAGGLAPTGTFEANVASNNYSLKASLSGFDNQEIPITVLDAGMIQEYEIVFSSVEAISCDGSLNFSGNQGIYELDVNFGSGNGEVALELEAFSVPDRFQIVWNNQIVADSLYVGDGLAGDTSELLTTHSLNRFSVDSDSNAQQIGNENLTISSADLSSTTLTRADNSSPGQINVNPSYPSPSSPASHGNVIIGFNKTAATPSLAKLIVYAPLSGTAWNLRRVICAPLEGELRIDSGISLIDPKEFVANSLSFEDGRASKNNGIFVEPLNFRSDSVSKIRSNFDRIITFHSSSTSINRKNLST